MYEKLTSTEFWMVVEELKEITTNSKIKKY